MMKWEPNDILRLISLIGGFLLCFLGSYLMWLGVGAEGAVDIKSSILSGSIKTGSAGLFIIFFGFFIILFVIAKLSALSSMHSINNIEINLKARNLARAFTAFLVSFLGSSSLAALGFGQGFAVLAAGLFICTIFSGVAYLEVAENK